MDNQPQQLPPSPPGNSGGSLLTPQNPTQAQTQVNSSQYSPTPTAQPAPIVNSPALIVLQWLTYAFWGWTVLAVSCLTVIVLANFIAGADDGSFAPYAIAAVLVLLPISVGCDVFYSKKESDKKTGGASIVMVIHAVLFAIFGIGALIAIVISLVQLFTSSSDTTNIQVALYSEIIITLLYAVVFLRTLHPARLTWFRRLFSIIMVIAVGIISVLGIVGPVAHAHATRNDRLIDDNLSTVQQHITDYVNAHKQLPNDLGVLGLNGDTKKLADNNLVQYVPNSRPAAVTPDTNASSSSSYSSTSPNTPAQTALPKTYYYELCVNYKKSSGKSNNYESSSSSSTTDSNGYSDYISTDHPAGHVCYKAKTTPY